MDNIKKLMLLKFQVKKNNLWIKIIFIIIKNYILYKNYLKSNLNRQIKILNLNHKNK